MTFSTFFTEFSSAFARFEHDRGGTFAAAPDAIVTHPWWPGGRLTTFRQVAPSTTHPLAYLRVCLPASLPACLPACLPAQTTPGMRSCLPEATRNRWSLHHINNSGGAAEGGHHGQEEGVNSPPLPFLQQNIALSGRTALFPSGRISMAGVEAR